MMMNRLRRHRSVTIATLLVWWLWSAMAVCHAGLVVEGNDSSWPTGSGMAEMAAPHYDGQHLDSIAMEKGGGHDMPCHDSQPDSFTDAKAAADCCDQAETLRSDHSADIDFPVIRLTATWPAGIEPSIPVANLYQQFAFQHHSQPRLHLLLSVFLD